MVIYIVENVVNGKRYIGKDSKNDPNYLGSGKHQKQALKKYGRSSFRKEILEQCNTLDELNQRELYWINKYNAVERDDFYNLTDTITPCRKGKPLSEEHKQRLSFAAQNRPPRTEEELKYLRQRVRESLSYKDTKHSEETKQKISKANKGKSKSESHRKAMSDSRKGVAKPKRWKPVVGVCITTQQVVEFPSIKAAEEAGFSYRGILHNIKGTSKSSGGYCWSYGN